jgi:glycosyltransferase involved in cell wall biosynthesis
MRILFLHNAFPGQYGALATALAREHQVVFASAQAGSLPGVKTLTYAQARPVRPDTHPYLRWMEDAVLTGQAVYRLCHGLKRRGFVPDVVCAHSGWGPALYVKEIFPDCRLVGYFEWFYRTAGADADFLEPLAEDDRLRLATRNAALLLDLASSDAAVCPTRFQAEQFPQRLRPLLNVLHDGVDTEFFTPGQPEAEIVTYATRGMEPYRGFPQFMRAAALIQRRRPQARIVVAGDDRVVYGARGDSWKARMLAELPQLDQSRLHFAGTLPTDQYRALLQTSSAHVYLTVPFVLSWSLLDAMACGTPVVGSDTAPVREVIEHGTNGLLADFHCPESIADQVVALLEHRDHARALGRAARATVEARYALKNLLPRHVELITGCSPVSAPDPGP